MRSVNIIITFAVLAFANAINSSHSTFKEKLDPELWTRVEDFPDEPTDVIVVLRPPPESKFSENGPRENTADFLRADGDPLTEEQIKRCAIIKALDKFLQDLHDKSAAKVIAALVQLAARFVCFSLNNTCFVYAATIPILKALTEIYTVEKIIGDIFFKIPKNPGSSPGDNRPPNDCTGEMMEEIQWHVQRMKADRMWELGITGRGITVAVIDTGAYKDHVALKDHMRDDYNWLDPYEGTETPRDSQPDFSHGTAVTGNIVGGDHGIGTAKDAQWMACMALNSKGQGNYPTILKCLQWTLCPTLPDGTKKDCCKSPDIINMSFGTNRKNAQGGIDAMDKALKSLREAGIILVVAAGNDGWDGCETVGYPAVSQYVIPVGATNQTDYPTWFTSAGPGLSVDDILPSFCAPGDKIMTAAWRNKPATDPKCYQLIQGTSFSSPLTAGAVALFKSWDYNLSQDDIKEMFIKGAEKLSTYNPNDYEIPMCKDELFRKHIFPNNIYGHGFVNCETIYKNA